MTSSVFPVAFNKPSTAGTGQIPMMDGSGPDNAWIENHSTKYLILIIQKRVQKWFTNGDGNPHPK